MRNARIILMALAVLGLGACTKGSNPAHPTNPGPDTSAVDSDSVTIIDIDRTTTWQSRFIKDESEIPIGEYQAFYFEDSLKTITAYTERVSSPVLNYESDGFHGIPARRFRGYWIGDFRFSADAGWDIKITQWGQSTARIVVDGKEVFFGAGGKTVPHTFTAGIHRIEIEFKNSGDQVSLSVQLSEITPDVPVDSVPPDTADYWYAGVHKASDSDGFVQVMLKKSSKPVTLFLASYHPVHWKISVPESTHVAALYYSSYEGPSTVTGLPDSVPMNLHPSLPYVRELYPVCDNLASTCQEPLFQNLIAYLKKEFGIHLTSFTGGYEPGAVMLPDVELTPTKYKQIEAETNAMLEAVRDYSISEVFKGDTAATWLRHFVYHPSLIPVGQFRAFYFNEKTAYSVAQTEVVANPAISFSYSFDGIPARNFGAYWVGKFEYAVPSLVNFALTTHGQAETAIFIDNVKLYRGSENKVLPYTFQPGTHTVEVEHLNNLHVADITVTIVNQ